MFFNYYKYTQILINILLFFSRDGKGKRRGEDEEIKFSYKEMIKFFFFSCIKNRQRQKKILSTRTKTGLEYLSPT